jgi:hypothetical protein
LEGGDELFVLGVGLGGIEDSEIVFLALEIDAGLVT